MTAGANTSCLEGGHVHTWKATGLDVSTRGQLVNTRSCYHCGLSQSKPYGGRSGWSTAR